MYPRGGELNIHKDGLADQLKRNFNIGSPRLFTLSVYFNDDWKEEDKGRLIIYDNRYFFTRFT